MAEYQNNDPNKTNFALFHNDYKTTDRHPELRGTIEINRELLITMNERAKDLGFPLKMDVSVWEEKESRNGNPYRSAQFQMGWVKDENDKGDPLPGEKRGKKPLTEPDDDLGF